MNRPENSGPRKRPDPRRQAGPVPAPDERLGRFLAYVLRHHPEKIALELDQKGSADIDALVGALLKRSSFQNASRTAIERLAASAVSGDRFEVIGNRIRARYGHSLPQPVEYEAAPPPPVLFHATTEAAARIILKDGLKGDLRRRVHLSTDAAAARTVGLRRTPIPVILRVDTARAAKAGVRFYPGGPTVWLSDNIAPDCISRGE